MRIINSLQNIKGLSDFYQLELPVAITAPLVISGRVLIGVYGPDLGHACIDVCTQEFEELKAFLYTPKWFRLAVHGIKRIWKALGLGNLDASADLVLDTELMASLLNSGAPDEDYCVSHLVHEYLNEDYLLWLREIADRLGDRVRHEILAWDAYLVYQLAYVLHQQIRSADPDLAFMYTYGEVPLVTILLEMTRHGIGVDGAGAAQAYAAATRQANELCEEITYGEKVNLWNGAQVYELLRSHGSRIQLVKKEVTTRYLELLAVKDPLAARILEWRDLQTDLSFLRTAAGATRVHPEWETRTLTGRIYASRPPVQNVNKLKYRPLFVAAPGCILLKADYKHLQMRLLANMSQDPELIRVFREGKDVHWLTVEMCGIEGGSDEERRNKAKEVNYGILFQITAYGLGQVLGTSTSTAQGYINTFWSRYAVAKEWLDNAVAHLKQKPTTKPYIQSYLGRRRHFSEEIGAREIRQAKATILQQSEAEVLRMALLSLVGLLRQRKMKSRVVMVLHDAIWVEAPEDEAAEAKHLLAESMTNAVELPVVPLEVDSC